MPEPVVSEPAARLPGRIVRAVAHRPPLVLAGVVVLVAAYHFIQALRRSHPWIFPDEVRYTEFARAVAETGSASVDGERPTAGILQSFLLAPAWLIDDPHNAWNVAKLITVVAFCLTAVPTYLLARRFAGAPTATVIAAAAILLPAAFYTGTMMQESFAYPIAVTAALFTVRLLERFRAIDVVALIGVCALGIGVRGQMVVLPLIAAGAFMADALAAAVRGRSIDRRPLFIGVALIVVGGLAFLVIHDGALLGDGLAAIGDDLPTFVGVITDSLGAAIVGMAVAPAVAMFAVLGLLGDSDRSRAAFAAVVLSAGVVLLAYTGLKSSSQGFVFITKVEERNLIYLQALALVAIAVVAGRSSLLPWIAGAAATVAALLIALPIMGTGIAPILSENPGMSWVWHVTHETARNWEIVLSWVLLAITGLAAAALTRRSLAPVVVVGVACLTTTMGVYSARGDRSFGATLGDQWLMAGDQWLDLIAGPGHASVVTTPELADLNGLYLTAFWNRSLRTIVVAPGTSGPGIAGSPVAIAHDGTFPTGGASVIVHPPTLTIRGTPLGERGGGLWATSTDKGATGQVLHQFTGLSPDGWVGTNLTVRRFGQGPAGALVLDVSMENPFLASPRRVEAVVGKTVKKWTLQPGEKTQLALPVPEGPFTADYRIDPAERPPNGDPRFLSVQVSNVTLPEGSR